LQLIKTTGNNSSRYNRNGLFTVIAELPVYGDCSSSRQLIELVFLRDLICAGGSPTDRSHALVKRGSRADRSLEQFVLPAGGCIFRGRFDWARNRVGDPTDAPIAGVVRFHPIVEQFPATDETSEARGT